MAAAADLARRRLQRGAPLGATEAIAYVCDEICEMAWDGRPLEHVVAAARVLLRPDQLLPEVPSLVPLIQVEALFPHGSTLVHVPAPFGAPDRLGAGAVLSPPDRIELAAGRERVSVRLRNTGQRSVWISSHFPLAALNPAVELDREAGATLRLDLPAGEAHELAPGADEELVAVRIVATLPAGTAAAAATRGSGLAVGEQQ
jgi:urease subunit gamma/beta